MVSETVALHEQVLKESSKSHWKARNAGGRHDPTLILRLPVGNQA